MSRVTTVTLPEELHGALVRKGKEQGRSMASIIRQALDRELRGSQDLTARRGARPKAPPANVLEWLRMPTGALSRLFRDETAEPADWNADAEDSGLDVD